VPLRIEKKMGEIDDDERLNNFDKRNSSDFNQNYMKLTE